MNYHDMTTGCPENFGRMDASRYVGMLVKGTVKSVHKEGVAVNVEIDGRIVNGTISPRCYGIGNARMAALSAVKPGDIVETVVRSFDEHTKSCSLVLPGYEHLPRLPKKEKRTAFAGAGDPVRVVKPAFKSEAAGTTFVFDFANICAALPMRVLQNVCVAFRLLFCQMTTRC